mmetsp:Transcript_19346/g.58168  ORF Transcript_19346/g.58168 Transcript_19346/m.58168 type:complete len:246 (-) Transcript_19346:133-870(-)
MMGIMVLATPKTSFGPVFPREAANWCWASRKGRCRKLAASATDSSWFVFLNASNHSGSSLIFRVRPCLTHSSATSCARVSNLSGKSTTSETNPMARASAASTFRPSSSITRAFSSPRRCGKLMLEHPSGVMPKARKGVWKVAAGTANIASHSAAAVTDAPIAGPLAATKSGFGKSRSAANRVSLLSCANLCSVEGHVSRMAPAKSTPLQKYFPLPVRIAAPTLSSFAQRCSASSMASRISNDHAL